MKRRECGFAKREQLANSGYWDDKRWEKVKKLREQGKQSEANGLVMNIRSDWGM
jgi:hypothetical protein